ncbi:hypothetical protein ZTR_03519 [Talaromyces verruculosus]|nr:hypothetical protein ZTR_03519 [Talaromyces verruculosus]
MAAATKNIGFGVTLATTIGWNVSYSSPLIHKRTHDDRYAIAEEYVKITYKLWESSWRDYAVVRDRERGVYTEPSPQRTPLILQAGTSKAGKKFAAQHAEAIFVAGHSPSVVSKNIAEIRELVRTEFGRDLRSRKFLVAFRPVLGRTEEEAQKKFANYGNIDSIEGALALSGGWTGIDLNQYDDDQELRQVESNAIRSAVEGWSKASPGVAKWTKMTVVQHITVGGLGTTSLGTPEQVADELERWVADADVHGFNFPGSFVDIIELLLPELRKCGLFWNDYAVYGGNIPQEFLRQEGAVWPAGGASGGLSVGGRQALMLRIIRFRKIEPINENEEDLSQGDAKKDSLLK